MSRAKKKGKKNNRAVRKQKRKLTTALRKARRERKKQFMMIFINGRQKWVPRPQLIEGFPVDEYIAGNADPIWLHENGYWESISADEEKHEDGTYG
jgi:hypothetical protein